MNSTHDHSPAVVRLTSALIPPWPLWVLPRESSGTASVASDGALHCIIYPSSSSCSSVYCARLRIGSSGGASSAICRGRRGRCSVSQYIKDRGMKGSIFDEYGADLIHMLWPLPYDKEIPTGSRHSNLFGSRLLLWLITRRVY